MLGYCPIPLYPNSIYMIVLNVLHSPRRKLRMKLQPHLPVQCDCSPSPSFPSPLLSLYPPPSVFPMDCDRKSTRLNSSHLGIPYPFFCLYQTVTRCRLVLS